MAKKAILDVLESTIGKYVRNLDAESLNVAVWKGNIELHSLELNVDAVNAELDRQAAEAPNLALPFKVMDGKFTSFEVVVPWSRITSRPVILRARGLNVVVEPCDRLSGNKFLIDKGNAEKEAKKVMEARAQSIVRANEARLRANALRSLADLDMDDEEIEKGSATSSTFTSRLVRRIIENLQLEVNDVHVSLRGCGCAAGVVLESLSLVTTDKDGNRTFVDRTKAAKDFDTSFLYKALQITGLGVYLDEDKSSVFSMPYTVAEKLQSPESNELQHAYILSPLSFGARLRQSDKVECVDFPKYLVSSELSQLSILLSRNQLELGNKVAAAIRPSQNVARPLFPEYRPLYRVSRETAKDWWKYAFRCIGRLTGRRSWVEFYWAFQKRKEYIPLYKRDAHHETCLWIKPLTPEEKEKLLATERDRAISREGIMTWRNIADAQVEHERKKHEKAKQSSEQVARRSSYMSSLFGSSASHQTQQGDENPPITLTVEEMKELEAISLAQSFEDEVSKNSKLYDIKFSLGAFKVDLISHGMRPIAALDMGTVTTTFDANADGSFAFDLKLSSLEVLDKATLRSLFPTVVRSLQSPSTTDGLSAAEAFELRLEKSKTGDQKLVLHMVAFEMVASAVLFLEVKRFFSLSKATPSQSSSLIYRQNPLLQQSLSGSMDLFYDAGEGPDDFGTLPIIDDTAAAAAAATAHVSDQLSSAIADAWKNKNKTQKTWTIDCDIHAPIVILPQNCMDPAANVLVFDLGHFSLKYGKIDAPQNVLKWYESQPVRDPLRPEPLIDYGVLAISNLMFVTGKAGDLDRTTNGEKFQMLESEKSLAVIEPVTLSLKLGIESAPDDEMPRICVFGVLPAVSLCVSPSQVSCTLSVVGAWKAVLEEMKGDAGKASAAADGLTILEEVEDEGSEGDDVVVLADHPFMGSTSMLAVSSKRPESEHKREKKADTKTLELFHVELALRRFSIKAVTDTGNSMEAHLVSVSASASHMLDGSSLCRLKMGWFWILDRLSSDFPRQQRLVAHSNLPSAAASYSHEDKYDVMGELQELGVFEDGFSGSSDLADITWKLSGDGRRDLSDLSDPFASDIGMDSEDIALSLIKAKFTSLFIQWNPQAIKAITTVHTKFAAPQRQAPDFESTIKKRPSQSPANLKSSPRRSFLESPMHSSRRFTIGRSFDTEEGAETRSKGSIFVLRAEMTSLEISLNSAIDDLPLFEMTMSGTNVKFVSSQANEQGNMKASFVLGDLRMEAPTNGKTRQSYRTLLGLAPNQSTSLLSVQYSMGAKAIQSLSLDNVDSTCDACAKIELSPMKLVYIHAQVFTLIEYVTEGILGALFAKAASSAKEAAIEIASSVSGGKIFAISATGVDLIIPQAAYSPQHLTLHAGDLNVRYHSPPYPGVSKASLSLSEVSMYGNTGKPMVETPIRMTVEVELPPIDVGTEEEQAMHVAVNISEASFLLSKPQYEQLMGTLGTNMGEKDSFLRGTEDGRSDHLTESCVIYEESSDMQLQEEENQSKREPDFKQDITHAGVAAVEQQRRMYIVFLVEIFSLELCGKDTQDAIVRMAAVKTSITMSMIPDKEKTIFDVTLLNLVCEDRRLKSMHREFRSLVSQASLDEADDDKSQQDVFQLSYVKYQNMSKEVDLKIGSPQFVFIPDAVGEVLNFFKSEEKTEAPKQAALENARKEPLDKEVEIHFNKQDGSMEASFAPMMADVAKTSVKISTSSCSVVLIDMGCQSKEMNASSRVLSPTRSSGDIIEAIVLRGSWNAQVLVVSEIVSGQAVKSRVEMHGESMEVYSAHGKFLESPLQIVDPVQLTIVVTSTTRESNATEVDIRMVTLSPIDMKFSMQNAALLNAVSSSISGTFDNEENDQKTVGLSEEEALHIEQLASALEQDNGVEVTTDGGVLHGDSSSIDESLHKDSVAQVSTALLEVDVKVTMPETKLTFINDLQGLDEALFRITAKNFVAGAQVVNGIVPQVGSTKQLTFDCNVNSSFLADYFDSSTNLWKELLVKPWEVTFNGARGVSKRFRSRRMSTTFDIESFPCDVSFSEQFLASIGAASRMWSVYSLAAKGGTDNTRSTISPGEVGGQRRKSMAVNAARSLITTLPYAIENHSGVDAFLSLHGERDDERPCPSGTIHYFRFEPPSGNGCGGQRLYGQDVTRLKGLSLLLCGRRIEFDNIDAEASQPRRVHNIGNGHFVMTKVVKESKTTVLHLSSQVDIHNDTSVRFRVAVVKGDEHHDVGVCKGKHGGDVGRSRRRRSSLMLNDGYAIEQSRNFGVPFHLLDAFGMQKSEKGEGAGLSLLVFPCLVTNNDSSNSLCGKIDISPSIVGRGISKRFDVICKAHPGTSSGTETDRAEGMVRPPDPFVVRAYFKMCLVDKHYPFVELFLEPRAVLDNKLPVSLCCRTPMPHTLSVSLFQQLQGAGSDETHDKAQSEVTHRLAPYEAVEIYTPGPSIAVSLKCADLPVGGRATGWMQGKWLDLPLVPEFRLPEPLRCVFPFERGSTVDPLARSSVGGSEFFIAEDNEALSETLLERQGRTAQDSKSAAMPREELMTSGQEMRYGQSGVGGKFIVTVCNYAVDHTGDVLFEQLDAGGESKLRRSSTSLEPSVRRRSSMKKTPLPFSAFSSPGHRRRITLLPDSTVGLRLLHLTMDGDEGIRRSLPFRVEDVSICEGGIESMPIRWEDESPSGFFAYRRLAGSYQSEVHVIPEFIVFNGSKNDRVLLRQFQGIQMILEPGRMAPIRRIEGVGLILSMDFIDLGVRTVPFPCDTLGLKMCVVKAADGSPLGSLAIQTVIGDKDSRLVVKLGQIKYGKSARKEEGRSSSSSMFADDLFRVRVRWSELRLTLNEAKAFDPGDEKPIMEVALDQMYNDIRPQAPNSPYGIGKHITPDGQTETWADARRRHNEEQPGVKNDSHQAVAIIILHRFTVDFQRIFKENYTASKMQLVESALLSPERSQLSVIIHNVTVKDCSPDATYPVVFDCTSNSSFFDLCVRCRGPLDADLVRVDLVDLNLAYANGKSERIVVETSEEFVWKLLDVINRILIATAELAGVDLQLEWDEEQGGYVVSVADATPDNISTDTIDATGRYTPPESDKLYDIHSVKVSPFTMLLSFKRQPQAARYKLMKGVRFAKLMNYFSKRLKFKIDKAELRFGHYEAKNVKGPPDRLFELLRAYYIGKIKLKFVTLMTAVSIQDWKYLASREVGDENWREGDYLRLTGNLAGSGAGYIFKKAGAGIGDGLSSMTGTLGRGIEDATGRVGARAIGVGVNSVVTGVGDGVGSTIKGVGAGAGKVFKGAGKGVGHVFGGVAGGAQQVVKGVGKGVVEGDGRAILSGIGEGVASVGAGVGQGAESVVTGAVDGVFAAGSGLFTGVQSIGKGIGGVFGGCPCGCTGIFSCCGGEESTSSNGSNQMDEIEHGQAEYHMMEHE